MSVKTFKAIILKKQLWNLFAVKKSLFLQIVADQNEGFKNFSKKK